MKVAEKNTIKQNGYMNLQINKYLLKSIDNFSISSPANSAVSFSTLLDLNKNIALFTNIEIQNNEKALKNKTLNESNSERRLSLKSIKSISKTHGKVMVVAKAVSFWLYDNLLKYPVTLLVIISNPFNALYHILCCLETIIYSFSTQY